MIDLVENLVDEYGEVHAVVSDHDDELELRQGTTVFHDDCVMVKEDDKFHLVRPDAIIRVYTPTEAFH